MMILDENTVLEGKNVRLVPMTLEYQNDLLKAANDGRLWELWYTSAPSESTIDSYLKTALNQKEVKSSLPFVVIDKSTETVIGTTRYCNIDSVNCRLEIGYT